MICVECAAASREGRRSPIVESREVAGIDRIAIRACLDRDSVLVEPRLFSVTLRIGRKRQTGFPLTNWMDNRGQAVAEGARLLRALADELDGIQAEGKVTP